MHCAPRSQRKFQFNFYVGAYYTTMFTEGFNYGFRNMTGPQIFPVIRIQFKNSNELSFYGKYALISQSGLSFQLSDREWATGIVYRQHLGQSKNLGFLLTLDFANIQMIVQGTSIASTSYSFGTGLQF